MSSERCQSCIGTLPLSSEALPSCGLDSRHRRPLAKSDKAMVPLYLKGVDICTPKDDSKPAASENFTM